MSAVTPIQTMRGHTGYVRGVVHLPGGRRIITCSDDGSLRLWDLEGGAQIGSDLRDEGHETGGVITIALSPNSTTVASGSVHGTVRLWDVETGKVVARWTRHTDVVWSVRWSEDGERVVSGSEDGTVIVSNVETGKPWTILGPIQTRHEWVWAAIYSPDSTKIATGGTYERAVKIWDGETGKLLSTIKHDLSVWSLAWTSDEKKLISGSSRGFIRIFDTVTWQEIAILEGHQNTVKGLSLFPNDRLLASVSWDKTARLWNLDTNLPVGPPLEHEDYVDCAAFSPDGKVLVTGCRDHNVYVWDVHTILNEAGHEDLISIPDVPRDRLEQKISAVKSLIDTDATRRPVPPKDAHRLPRGFFDNTQDGIHVCCIDCYQSSVTHGNHPTHSSARRHGSLSSFFHRSQPNTGEPNNFQQRKREGFFSLRRGVRTVEVATVQDKRTLVVARRPERDSDKPKRPYQSSVQASISQSQPNAASTTTTLPIHATSTTTAASATGAHAQSTIIIKNPTWLTRFFVFVCCVSVQHTDE